MQRGSDMERGVRVLLCDDQPIVGEALKQMLADDPTISIYLVDNPAAVAGAIDEFQPNVILQDLVLAESSGLEVVRMLRGESRYRDLPVIVLSTTEDAKTKFDAFCCGASDYIVKFPEKFELIGRLTYHSKAYVNLKAREEAQRALQQKSRLESLGNLAAGIAHEINTPLQYISANLGFVSDVLRRSQSDGGEIGAALKESIEGVEVISSIVRAMKSFAHPGKQEKVLSSINEIIRDVEVLSRNEWKDFAKVTLILDAGLPLVPCSPGAISQVLLNLVVNAAHAVKVAVEARGNGHGSIEISTRVMPHFVEIQVADNGEGIPDCIRERVFEPFFTTKDVGEGSGQGLSLARSTVVEGHGGEIEFRNNEAGGATFFVRLPLVDPKSDSHVES